MPFTLSQLDSLPKTATGALDLTKAERFAEGGTHVLYRFPNESFVIKVMKQNLSPTALNELDKKYAILYACFDTNGKERCIREQHVRHEVLLPSKAQAENLILSIVPYEKCFKAHKKFDFKVRPTELDPYLMEQNQQLVLEANSLINTRSSPAEFKLNDYGLLDEGIGAILQALDEDEELRVVMSEFLNHYRDFYQATNIILDTMGSENVLFYKDEQNKWQFKIGSVIKHDTGKFTNELFHKVGTGNKVDLTDFKNFTHAFFSPANIRAVNACALKLGLPPVIQDVMIDSQNLFKVSQDLSIPEKMLAYARHGDFEKMDKLLQDNKSQINFNPRNFWAYSIIADEYLKHGQTPPSLKKYLDTVIELPIEKTQEKDMAALQPDLKSEIRDMKTVHDKKIMLHQELKAHSKFSFWSTKAEVSENEAQTAENRKVSSNI